MPRNIQLGLLLFASRHQFLIESPRFVVFPEIQFSCDFESIYILTDGRITAVGNSSSDGCGGDGDILGGRM